MTVKVYDPALTTNPAVATYNVGSSDTLQSIAAGLATQLQSNITGSGISAVATSTSATYTTAAGVIALQILSPNVSTFTSAIGGTGSLSELVTAAPSLNGAITGVVGGTSTANDTVKVTIIDNGLSGGSKTESYLAGSGDSAAHIASQLALAINNDLSLEQIGVTATSSSATIAISSCSQYATSYNPYSSNSAGTAPGTETLLLGLPANGTVTATIASPANNDTVAITVYDAAFGSQHSLIPLSVRRA